MSGSAPSDLVGALERSLRARQAERLPSVVAAVVREGELIWAASVGLADCEDGVEAGPGTQYRIGSITKTVTALAVILLAEEGRLALDDRLDSLLPARALSSASLRQMLSHLSGIQREAGEMFVTGAAPSREQLLVDVERYERVLPAARAFHYSNLAYALLGEVVSRASGVPYRRFVAERILGPLRLARTTWAPEPPSAQGYLVEEFAGTVWREPDIELGAVEPMGQLWSTVGDLCRLAAFLGSDGQGILDSESLEQMWTPQTLVDPERWLAGYGLGLELCAHEGRVYGGHSGAMPGFLAGVYVQRAERVGAAVLTNSGTRLATRELCLELIGATLDRWPAETAVWRPEPEPPAEVRALLGRWWSEGNEFVFFWRRGKLTLELAGAAPWVRPSVFEPAGDGSFRVVSGRERGERLRIEQGQLRFGGYPFTREQSPSPG
jgi:CubicO group peptidase (beta-lactamase class C family)